jgi:hypothetical protein
MEFREQVDSNVRALDFYGSRKKINPNTGEETVGGDGSDLFHGVVVIVWSDELAMLTRAANYNGTKEELILSSVAGMMSLVPEGRTLDLHTESQWLVTEMEKTRGHVAADFSGELSWVEVPAPWKKVLEYVSNGSQVRGIQITSKQEQIPSDQDIMALYMAEMIERAEGEHLDAIPDEAPWA